MVKEFTRDYLINKLDLPWSAIEDNVIFNSRRTIVHEIVFKDFDGKFYQTTYRVSATVCQNECPWDYISLVKCIEVVKKQVVVSHWIPADQE